MTESWLWLAEQQRHKSSRTVHFGGVRCMRIDETWWNLMRVDALYLRGHHDAVPWIGQVADFFQNRDSAG